jgi:hypothetical protein
MKGIIKDPLLNDSDNIELRRRIFVNVISICEKLFYHYNKKAESIITLKVILPKKYFNICVFKFYEAEIYLITHQI